MLVYTINSIIVHMIVGTYDSKTIIGTENNGTKIVFRFRQQRKLSNMEGKGFI